MLKNTWVKVVLGAVLGAIMLDTLLVLFLELLFGGWITIAWMDWHTGDMPNFEKIAAGMTREQVVQLVGQPAEAYGAAQAPGHYPRQGYVDPERPVSGEVLIYDRGEWTVYVFLDPRGKVEEYRVAGS